MEEKSAPANAAAVELVEKSAALRAAAAEIV